HPDHIFGLMEKDTNKPVYPNAELIISDVEYKFWTDPAVIDRLPEARKGLARRIQAVFPTWKNIRQVEGEPEVAPGIRFVSSPRPPFLRLPRPPPRPSLFPSVARPHPAHDLKRYALGAGAGGRHSGLARSVRPKRGEGGGVPPQAARPRDRRQGHDLRLPLPV